MEVALLTGRTHQIRVHAQHAGHPVAGDEKYGDEEFNARMKVLGLNRMFLHAHSVSFEWPSGRDVSGAGNARAPSGEFSVNTPLPPELASVVDTLAAQKTRSRKR